MQPRHDMLNIRLARQVLAWRALMAITVLLTLLLQSLAASALVASRSAEPPTACQSTAGAALVHGNYVDIALLADVCRTQIADGH
jgi:hypothetical protein